MEQADLYGKWAVRAAEAKALADEAELVVELTEAKLQRDVRRDPAIHGIDSGGETAIKSFVKSMPEYAKARRREIEAKRVASVLAAAEKSMSQRKNMIEELVKLHGQRYFAGPDAPHDLQTIWDARIRRKKAGGTKAEELQRNMTRRATA